MSFIATGHWLGASCCCIKVSVAWRVGSLRVWLLAGCTWRSCVNDSVDFKTAQNGFRDLIDHGVSRMPEEIVELKGAVETINSCNFSWRGACFQHDESDTFFTMKPAGRTARVIPSLHKPRWAVFANSLEDFNALPYVKKWLASRHQGAFETQSMPATARIPLLSHAQNFRVIWTTLVELRKYIGDLGVGNGASPSKWNQEKILFGCKIRAFC